MNTNITSDVKEAYKKISHCSPTYGTYKKTLFHLHTPASYDYRLLERWSKQEYQAATDEDLLSILQTEKNFPSDFNIKTTSFEKIHNKYCNDKELLSYLMLAYELLIKEYEIVLVSDHNTISGIDKLEAMIEKIYSTYGRAPKYPEIISGIEFSCADKIHVVTIFDKNDENSVNEINHILNENLISQEDGIMLTSYILMERLSQHNCLSYMAHLNSADIFKDGKFLSGGYKKKLLTSSFADIIGVNNINNKAILMKQMKQVRKKDIHFVIDNDSHFIESLNENYFWIKGQIGNFQMIKEAFIDFDIAISYEERHNPEKYIKGFLIKYKEQGFLKGKDKDKQTKEDFCVQLSPSLNCFIGGRGTGKSTVLQLLDYALGQNCGTKRLLDFLCFHGNVYILYKNHYIEYIIKLYTIKKSTYEDIMQYFSTTRNNNSYDFYQYDKNSVKEITQRKYIELFKITKKNNILHFEKIKNKRILLNEFYDTRYSINELVNTACGDTICQFIMNTMFKTFSRISDTIKIRSTNGLINKLKCIHAVLSNRELAINQQITKFNQQNKNVLRIKYTLNKKRINIPFKNWIDIHHITSKYDITKNNIYEYIEDVYYEIGFINILCLAFNINIPYKREQFSIIPYKNKRTEYAINKETIEINKNNELVIINKIFDDITKKYLITELIHYFKKSLDSIEDFTLEFNINNKEENTNVTSLYKDIRDLSLGQKVVAMLDFILAYAKFSGDNRPLIIDQPEDNLDSRYIYKNLVNKIRTVKNERQIILATHNATIVTNTMTDNVCVMESDGYHGWIKTTGYPGNKKMKKNIINYMEGGIESFKHKMQIYEEALK